MSIVIRVAIYSTSFLMTDVQMNLPVTVTVKHYIVIVAIP